MQWPPSPGPGSRAYSRRPWSWRLDRLPNIDPHGFEDDLGFVDQRDVDGPEDVLGQLHRLGRLDGRNRHGVLDHITTERNRKLQGLRSGAPDDFRDRRGGEVDVAEFLAFRRIGQEEFAARDQPALSRIGFITSATVPG